jgi:hypothetical protein
MRVKAVQRNEVLLYMGSNNTGSYPSETATQHSNSIASNSKLHCNTICMSLMLAALR